MRITYALFESAVVFIPSLLLSSCGTNVPVRSLILDLEFGVLGSFSLTSQFGRRRNKFRRSRSSSSRARWISSCCLLRKKVIQILFY